MHHSPLCGSGAQSSRHSPVQGNYVMVGRVMWFSSDWFSLRSLRLCVRQNWVSKRERAHAMRPYTELTWWFLDGRCFPKNRFPRALSVLPWRTLREKLLGFSTHVQQMLGGGVQGRVLRVGIVEVDPIRPRIALEGVDRVFVA